VRSIPRAAAAAGAALAIVGVATGCAATAPHATAAAAAKVLAATTTPPASPSSSPSTATAAASPSSPAPVTTSPKTTAPAVAPKTTPPTSPGTPSARSAAPAGDPCSAAAAACVSLSRQEAWFVRDGQVVMGPMRVATGRPGYRTELGTFHVFRKNQMWYSTIYNNAPMPWSVFFDGGEAFHEDSVYVMSHGCVHVSATYAEDVYNFLHIGDEVQVVS
jgi:lipoprotein-anchoring transpeptidase ErfK/SrfK